MKNYLIAFIFIVITFSSPAQGIAGRRLSLEVEFDYFMRYSTATEKFFSIGGKSRVGYIIAKQWQVYAGINYYKLNFLQSVRDSITDDVLGDATDYINCVELDLTARYFLPRFGKREFNCIAPDGKYMEFSLITTKTQYSPGELPYYGHDGILSEYKSTRVSFGFGNQQVWWDRMIVNTGLLVSMPVYSWTRNGALSTPYKQWQKGHNMFRAYVGIGLLL